MPNDELLAILDKAESILKKRIKFTYEAKNDIVTKSNGFPYFAHFIGKEAVISSFEKGNSEITSDNVLDVFRKLSDGKFSTIYEDAYQNAVKSSPQREILLKLFSEQEDNEIQSEIVYSLAKEFKITNPSQLMKELTTPEKGTSVLTKIREGYYRFTDPVFKIYAGLRTWKY